MTTPVLDVVIPVHNEAHTVAACVRRLHDHLVQTFPYPFRITVADNASTDATCEVASVVADELPGVVVVRMEQKGRGRALQAVWLASDAPILAYMDVDLSTDLDAVWPLVAPLMSGHSDVAIGSRLATGARVVRGAKREVGSRGYSRVDVVTTAMDDLRGIRRLRGSLSRGRLPVAELAARIGRASPGSNTWRQLRRFAVVGVASTVAHLGLFATLTAVSVSSQAANASALLLATLFNTAANRRWTFERQGPGAARHQAQGLAVFGVTWLMTAGALGLLHAATPAPATAAQTAVVALATAASTVVRFVAMRSWMFRPEAQYSVRTNSPESDSKTTMPIQSAPSTSPRHTVTSP
jgi:putative flippase GtrA